MTDKHTPGPWVAKRDEHPPRNWRVTAADSVVTGSKYERVVCLSQATKSAEANARLIAAAPELLKACEDALKATDYDLSKAGRDELRATLGAAIHRARSGE